MRSSRPAARADDAENPVTPMVDPADGERYPRPPIIVAA